MLKIITGPESSLLRINKVSVVITGININDEPCQLMPLTAGGHRIVVLPGQITRFSAELRDAAGNLLDISPDFCLPITGLFGQAGRTFTVKFTNGLAEFGINWPDSGEWKVTQESMNEYIDNSVEQYLFGGLAITVSEATI